MVLGEGYLPGMEVVESMWMALRTVALALGLPLKLVTGN